MSTKLRNKVAQLKYRPKKRVATESLAVRKSAGWNRKHAAHKSNDYAQSLRAMNEFGE
jgi:hypothetical protein